MVPKALLRSANNLMSVSVRRSQQPARSLASKTKPLQAVQAHKIINEYEAADNVTIPKPFDAKATGFSGRSWRSAHRTAIAGEAVVNTADGSFIGRNHFKDFDLAGGVYIVTGGARGLGLSMAEALCEAGGKGMVSH